jgi:predicted nucleic acid-binding protein
MMNELKTVYLETTIISYLAALPSRDLIKAARQEVTREWWNTCRGRYAVYTSQVVAREAREGDPDAARRRLELVSGLPLLDVTDEAINLAVSLISKGLLPDTAGDDALHLSVAAVHGVDYLLTWNCTHLANAAFRDDISFWLAENGYDPPSVCTPDELME